MNSNIDSIPASLNMVFTSETLNGFVNLPYEGNVDLHVRIPKQNIVLKQYMVVTDSTGGPSLLYVDIPALSAHNLIDGRTYMSRLPLMVDNTKLVTIANPNLSLGLHSAIEPRFKYKVFNIDSTLATNANLVTIDLQFNVLTDGINQ